MKSKETEVETEEVDQIPEVVENFIEEVKPEPTIQNIVIVDQAKQI